MRLSVLDLIPVRVGQTSRESLLVSRELVAVAEKWGYTRYWVAEHHNTESVASTVPAVLIPFLAEGTRKIRFGSGGVMLPNHAAFAVAEQFALLGAMYPGRIDLGIGRAPGTDQVIASLLRRADADAGVKDFARDVELLRSLLSARGPLRVRMGAHEFDLRATPEATDGVPLWLLGSSGYSLQLAAEAGFPYVFANHFGMPGVVEALTAYREQFVPSQYCSEPETLVPVNVVVGESEEEAQFLARPYLLTSAKLRTGQRLGPQPYAEQAAAHEWSAAELSAAETVRATAFIGTPGTVAERLVAFADKCQVDELMIVPVAGSSATDSPASAVGRVRTLEALGELLL